MSTEHFSDPRAPAAPVHRLSNGRYQVQISNTGAGQSSWNGLALNRWRNDAVQEDLGSILYLRDRDDGSFWSIGYQPTRTPTPSYRTEAGDGRFLLERTDAGIEARLEVTVAPETDLEHRRLRLQNRSDRPRWIEVTSYLEVVLFYAEADAAHPAFAKLFVETERDPASGALLARRRPRAEYEHWPWMVHALVGGAASAWETDRMRFLGRGRTPQRPAAMHGPLCGTVGKVLDPIFSLRTMLALGPGETAEVVFVTGVAPDRAAAIALVPTADKTSNSVAVPAAEQGQSAASAPPASPAAVGEGQDLRFFNGYGGFAADGKEYVIRLPWEGDALRRPPLPWINVIANERCGLLVSESGAGYTWARNSQANRLTPWSNDPVSDPHGEAVYLRDEASGEAWSPLPGPMPALAGYEARHGFGYSRFHFDYGGLVQETTLFVPRRDPVRILRLRLTNHGTQPRRLSVFSYQALLMGSQPSVPSPILTAFDGERELLRASNPQAGDFADGIVFACAAAPGTGIERVGFSCDRSSFIGRHRGLSSPLAIEEGTELDGACGAGLVPCFAQQVQITLAPGATAELAFLLGECLSEQELGELVTRYRKAGAVQAALEEVTAFWSDLLSRVQVETPSPVIDLMVNGWLLYQNLACRIWARSAFYQSGGAYGYRDQLQDAAALAAIRPELTRAQSLLHAAHQLVEGDVLHWWHPAPMERGLRTRFSDDLLWLPYLVSYYVRSTGDTGVLDEQAPFLSARTLEPGEDEAYLRPEVSGETADLYRHCCRALDRSMTRGTHGLPLMGTGDWNDGMNRVGREGRGESVWLGFFLYRILGDFLPLCEGRGDGERASRYRDYREALQQALEVHGWDGAWYRRAYYDDGTPLGAAGDTECRIDALAQSWAVISGAAPRERADQAMDAVEAQLVSEDETLIRLLTPPFVDTPHDPGYIKGYLAGVRENGGQYTHAACWTVKALAELGRRERAARLLEMLTPIAHTDSWEAVERYRLEPYAVAADIYGAPPHVGRGGWSWYTGSAGWMYRVALESVLGLTVENGRSLVIQPCIPDDWRGFRVHYRLPDDATECEIIVENASGDGRVTAARLDGQAVPVTAGVVRTPLPPRAGSYRIEVYLR
jgi:N,N'-diacetylchitobiose phosphorylase